MDYTFFMLPLSIIPIAERGSDENGTFLSYGGRKIYRMHLIGSVAAIEINRDSGSGYIILDDTFSSILVHFQRGMFNSFDSIQKGNLVEVLGIIDVYNDTITMSMSTIRRINLGRYMYNKIESIKNMNMLAKNGIR